MVVDHLLSGRRFWSIIPLHRGCLSLKTGTTHEEIVLGILEYHVYRLVLQHHLAKRNDIFMVTFASQLRKQGGRVKTRKLLKARNDE